MNKKRINECQHELSDHLVKIRDSILSVPLLQPNSGEINIKVWVLPFWYVQIKNHKDELLSVYNFTAEAFHFPRFKKVAELCGHRGRTSGIRWSPRIGFLGQLAGLDKDLNKSPSGSIVHGITYPANIEELSRKKYREIRTDVCRQLSRRQVALLRNLYGCAVGTVLRRDTEKYPFGCVVVDTPKGTIFDQHQIAQCIFILESSAPAIAKKVLLKLDR